MGKKYRVLADFYTEVGNINASATKQHVSGTSYSRNDIHLNDKQLDLYILSGILKEIKTRKAYFWRDTEIEIGVCKSLTPTGSFKTYAYSIGIELFRIPEDIFCKLLDAKQIVKREVEC
jgi:hypothetical protein